MENRSALDGFAVVQDYEQERNGAVGFRGHGVFSWDAQRRCHVLHWFDSMGMPGSELVGKFEGGVLTVSKQGPQGHAHWQTFMEGRHSKGL